jgi:hypothetical protein
VPTPTLTVELGLDLSAQGGPFFKLDDSVQGVLDGETFRLGGTLFYDVTDYVKNLSVSRGRSRELDKYQTGTCNLTFKNQDRRFDPSNTAGPYWPDIRPRREMRVSASGTPIFAGVVDDWSLSYDISGQSDAQASCVDGFALLAQRSIAAHTATAQLSGARIGAVLSRPEVNWPSTLRALDAGVQALQADEVADDTDALGYLQLVEQSEPGSFFISTGGTATFKDRNTAAVVGAVTFSDAGGSAIPYTSINVQFGTENLYNKINITRLNGDVQTANYAPSQSEYGITTLDQTGLLMDTDANALALANYLLGRYQEPELRFEDITVELAALSTAHQASVLGLELTNVTTVTFTPNQTGTAITQRCQIIGINHDARPDSHRVTLRLAATDGKVAFVLDSDAYGVLDTSTLGF